MEINPFTLSFGKEPELFVSRFYQTDKIVRDFCSPKPVSQAYIITGVRGSGKTVMMSSIAQTIAEDSDWVVIEVNASAEDMLLNLASKLYSHTVVNKIIVSAKIDLSILGIGVAIEGAIPISDSETAIEKILGKLKEKNKKVLLTVDEASKTKQMKMFVSAFQIFIRHDYPIFLLMTGLYDNIENLQNDKALTFLYRAEKLYLDNLPLPSVAKAYAKVFNSNIIPIEEIVKKTNGYPYAFQTLGYLLWESKEKTIDAVIDEYEERLAEYVYRKIWSELSAVEKGIIIAIARDECNVAKKIIEVTGYAGPMLSNYKNRLQKKGILKRDSTSYELCLPMFKEFVLAELPYEEE